VVAVVHDYPTLVKHPGAGVLPSSTRLTSMLGYRVMSPLLDDWLMRLFLRRAACVAVLSDEARIGWRDGVRGGLVVIPHGSFPVSDRAVLPSMGRYVLFAGYIGQSKGVDLLLRAWEKIASASPLELVIAGESQGVPDPELERLRVRAESLPSPPRWVGFVASERELQDLIAKAAVVVLPYRKSSPASGILARAMLEGRAIVVSSVPATRTTIHDQLNGLLVAPGDVAELTDALRRMIEDPALRDRLGASARACADRVFSSEIQSGRLASAYERLLADKRVSG
jgi:glycosyltransferase involved in cell wall biosynthesis